jgi:hypothetical protein
MKSGMFCGAMPAKAERWQRPYCGGRTGREPGPPVSKRKKWGFRHATINTVSYRTPYQVRVSGAATHGLAEVTLANAAAPTPLS